MSLPDAFFKTPLEKGLGGGGPKRRKETSIEKEHRSYGLTLKEFSEQDTLTY